VLYIAFMNDSDVDDTPPSWWPYAAELPNWHVWRGVSGLVYARWRNSSPPVVVRGEDAVDLRDQIRREQFLRAGKEEMDKPGDEFRSPG
jgi:hypothetical protein